MKAGDHLIVIEIPYWADYIPNKYTNNFLIPFKIGELYKCIESNIYSIKIRIKEDFWIRIQPDNCIKYFEPLRDYNLKKLLK